MNYCRNISNSSFRNLKGLRSLFIINCTQLSEDIFENLENLMS